MVQVKWSLSASFHYSEILRKRKRERDGGRASSSRQEAEPAVVCRVTLHRRQKSLQVTSAQGHRPANKIQGSL